jgi:hypothetical protein
MCEPQTTTQDDIRVHGSDAPSNPTEEPRFTPIKPRRRPPATLMRKQQSAPNLNSPDPSVWGIVKAVPKLQSDGDESIYSEAVEKYVAPEFETALPITAHHVETKTKLVIPLSIGRVSERLHKMNKVPAIFDILEPPKITLEGYSQTISKAKQQERIREILSQRAWWTATQFRKLHRVLSEAQRRQ